LFALFGVAIIDVDVGVDNDFFLPLQDGIVDFANTAVLARAAAVIDVCENIRNGYLYDGDLVFVILKGIYGFKFPKRFFGDLFQRSHFFSSSFLFCQS
jgi:hypothetical protein